MHLHARRRLVFLLVFLRMVLLNSSYFFLPLYLRDAGVTGWMNGLLLSLFAITALVSAFQTGIFTDRYPIRHLASLGALLLGAFNVLLAVLPPGPALIPVFLVGGLGNTILETSLPSFILKTARPGLEGRAFGGFQLAVGLGVGLGMGLGGLALSSIGFTPVFWGASVLFLGLSVLSQSLGSVEAVHSPLVSYARDLRASQILPVALGFGLMATHWGAEIACLTPFLRDNLGLADRSVGLYLGTAIPFLGVFGFVGGLLLDKRLPLVRVCAVGLAASALGAALMTIPIPWVSWSARALHELGDGFIGVTMFQTMSRVFPRERIGGLASFLATAMIMSRFLGTLVFAALGAAWGYHWAILVSAAITALALIPLIPALVRVGRQQPGSGLVGGLHGEVRPA
jgi:MFS family permease